VDVFGTYKVPMYHCVCETVASSYIHMGYVSSKVRKEYKGQMQGLWDEVWCKSGWPKKLLNITF
jgi:hypothetical protein